mgnify:CR=1 FL=1
MPTLDELRQRLNEIDAGLIELIAERQEKSREIAGVKRATGHATRDYGREREVILGAREAAQKRGVSPQVAETLMRMLIRSSLATQEQASVVAHGAGTGQRALVIGGAGKMGRWFADFLLSQGFEVSVSDPSGAPSGTIDVGDFRAATLDHDFIVVATPLGLTDGVLRDLAMLRPAGVILDLGSLKSPLRGGLMALKSHGCKVTSVHPMFGPDTELLSGRHVIFVDVGSPEALQRDWSQAYKPNQGVEDAWLTVFEDARPANDLYQLAEELTDLADIFGQWRQRHVTSVERQIGYKTGTGGTSGVEYLRRIAQQRFFPELWTVRTRL